MTRKRNLEDPNWAKWQVYCNRAPVGDPVLAVSDKQAIHIKRNKQTGIVCYDKWTAERVSLTLEEAESLAEHDAVLPGAAICSDCGYSDPSPTDGICPSCGSLHVQNPD